MNKSLALAMKVFLSSIAFLSVASATSYPAEQAEVEAFLASHSVARVTNYCRTDVLNCRSVVQYKSNSTGQMVASFEDRFVASSNSRAVSFRGFFLKQSNGRFNVFAQNKMVNQVSIDTVEAHNQNVIIPFDGNNLPTLSFKFAIVGTSPAQFELDTLIYTSTEATFNNNTPADSSDDYVIPFHSQTNH